MIRLFSPTDANLALNNVRNTSSDIVSSTGKLSSGSRLNTAADDAAALSIGSRLQSEVAALNTATSNTRQASSLLQLADGSVARVQDILTRMRALSVQAGSANLADSERELLDLEYQALLEEIERIARDTEFNGQNILAAENVAVTLDEDFQEGQNGVVNLTVRNFNNRSILQGGDGQLDFSVEYSASGNTNVNTVLATGTDSSVAATASASATDPTATGTAATAAPLTTASASAVSTFNTTAAAGFAGNTSQSFYNDPTQFDLTIGASQNADTNNNIEFTTRFDSNVIDGFGTPQQQLNGGLIIRLTDGVVTGDLSDQTTNDSEIILVLNEDFNLNPNPALIENPPNAVVAPTLLTLTESFSVNENDVGPTTDLDFKVGSGINPNEDSIETSITGTTLNNLALENQNIRTQGNADLSNQLIQQVIDEVVVIRSDLAGSASQVTSAARNLASTIENTEAARSNLLDLNIAQEITRTTASQVLYQSGISILAQAESFRQQLVADLLA